MAFDFTGLGSIADLAKGLVDRFLPPAATEAEKMQAQIQVQEMLDRRESSVLEAQRSVMVAEMQQADEFTKRARPSIVYFGLAAIGLVHVILPMVAWVFLAANGKPLTDMPDIQLPSDFWLTWGGVCSIWVIGRSVEKRGVAGVVGRVAGAVTGGKHG
jgi:hypothetical protein